MFTTHQKYCWVIIEALKWGTRFQIDWRVDTSPCGSFYKEEKVEMPQYRFNLPLKYDLWLLDNPMQMFHNFVIPKIGPPSV